MLILTNSYAGKHQFGDSRHSSSKTKFCAYLSIPYPLSVIPYPLSVIRYPLSAILFDISKKQAYTDIGIPFHIC